VSHRGRFRQIEVTRALKAAKAAGVAIGRIEIDVDGKIIVIAGQGGPAPEATESVIPPSSAIERWKARQNGAKRVSRE
jgi:hypothetical protein